MIAYPCGLVNNPSLVVHSVRAAMGERQRILGIDLGIASCGWGIIEAGEKDGTIVAAGVRCFDAPLSTRSDWT
jgi:hypothetical protein